MLREGMWWWVVRQIVYRTGCWRGSCNRFCTVDRGVGCERGCPGCRKRAGDCDGRPVAPTEVHSVQVDADAHGRVSDI
jgi:hypothetical protein